MAEVTKVEALEESPNGGVKTIWITVPNTTDAGDYVSVDLGSYGISEDGILGVDTYVHTDSGAVATAQVASVSVLSGTLKLIFHGTDNDFRACKITGKSAVGEFS